MTVLGEAQERIQRTRKGDVHLTLAPPAGVSLAGARASLRLTRHAFRFGCNAFLLVRGQDQGLVRAYGERFAALLNYATLPFYWGYYEEKCGVTQEAAVREAAAWCQERGIATKGHPLAWQQVYPEWAKALPDDEVIRLQRQRITDIVGGFRGLVDTWDVVNEATVAQRFDNAIGRWVGKQPAAVVSEALRLAHAANPQAELLYNDFDHRSSAWEQLVRDLVASGAPLTALGLQSHMHVQPWPLREVWAICERAARYNRPLHFTELTVLSGRLKPANDSDWMTTRTDWPITPEGEEDQARYGEAVYTLLYSHPAMEAITWWDFSDYRAWQGAPAGLVHADMSPKPLYERLMKLIWGEWATHHETVVGPEAVLTVRCAAGDHLVEVKLSSGDMLTGVFTAQQGKEATIVVTLS